MYVCMHVYMYECMYVRMYVCMYVCVYVCSTYYMSQSVICIPIAKGGSGGGGLIWVELLR